MRKIVGCILGVVGICFLIPIFFTTKFKTQEVFNEEKVILDIEKYSYSNFQTIKLLHTSTEEVEEIRTR